MKKLLLILYLPLIFIASKCDPDEIEPDPPKQAVLKTHPVKRAYYNPQFQRYITNQFTTVYKDFVYPFRIEQGKKYRFQMYGIDMSAADLYITNTGGIPISAGTTADIPEAGEYIIYEAPDTDTVHIFVRATDAAKVAQKQFYIAIEELDAYILEWKGHRWLCDGDWAVNTDGEMVYKGYKTGYHKWIQLLDKNLPAFEVSFNVHSPNDNLKEWAGMIVTASNQIDHGYNLPALGRYFRVRSPNQWDCMLLNSGSNTSGGSTLPGVVDFTSFNISSTIAADSVAFFVDAKQVWKVPNETQKQQLFFVVDDKTMDNVVLRDFTLVE